MKIVVIQFRPDFTRDHERKCIDACVKDNLDAEVVYYNFFDANNALQNGNVAQLLAGADRIILGGSAGLYVAAGHDESVASLAQEAVQAVRQVMDEAIARGIPVLGICFGHHALAAYFGGEVRYDEAQAETGFTTVTLTPAARTDPLVAGLESCFVAIEGHQDTVTTLGTDAKVLASSEACAVQIVRYGAHLVWGVQFHPELNGDEFLWRVQQFPEYLEYANSLKVQETPIPSEILSRFCSERIFAGPGTKAMVV